MKAQKASVPKFLKKNKENQAPDSLALSPPVKQEPMKGDKGQMSADFSRILKQINLSPVANSNANSFNLNPQPIQCSRPTNPLLQPY